MTDLAQLSSANTTASLVANPKMLAGGTPAAASTASPGAPNAADANLNRLFLSNPAKSLYTEAYRPAGEAALLNAKARQFRDFSYPLLNQTMNAAQEIETTNFAQRKLPEDIKPVVLIATLTAQGRLTDLAIRRRSGVAIVDRAIIESCKKGLWAMNPPPAALASDGTYRIRIEALVGNYTYNVAGEYKYVTRLGLALE